MTTALPAPAKRDTTHPALIRRRAAFGLVTTLLCLPVLPACALDTGQRAQPVEASIVDRDTGQPLTVYRKDGRAFIAGQPATRYAIRLANRSGGRVLVVLSVDGINVISGETAAVGQTGYVLDPWQSHDITGWRKSDKAVAAFEFAALSDSYAARTGRSGNVGVIGAAVFLERPVPAAAWPAARLAEAADAATSAAPAPRADGTRRAEAAGAVAQSRERLGTAHGQREWSASERTSFERLTSRPQQLLEIAYDSHANLVAAGVIVRPLAQARAFPDDDTRDFVPDPPRR